MPFIWTVPVEQEKLQYTEKELERYEQTRANFTDKGWLQSQDRQLIIPENVQCKILKGLHQSFHWVQRVLARWLLVCLKVKM